MLQKSITVIALSLVFAANVQAQDDHRERLEFGVKAGVNISNVWDSKTQEFRAENKTGFAGGAFVGIPIGKYFGIQPEVLISQKGFKAEGSLLGQPYSFTRTTTFVDVPLQFQFKPVHFLTLLGGPQYSYLLKQKDDYRFANGGTSQEEEFNKDNIRENILGFVFGADFIYQNVVLSGRAGWDFQTNNGDGTSDTPRYKNQWLQFTVGYKF